MSSSANQNPQARGVDLYVMPLLGLSPFSELT